jgi:hypothetical protein
MRRIVIVCEGYHDRSFWSGWLGRLQCRDCRDSAPQGARRGYDPHTGLQVAAGLFGFWSPADDWVLVTHAGGDRRRINQTVAAQLQTTAQGFDGLAVIANCDCDADVGAEEEVLAAHRRSLLGHIQREVDSEAKLEDGVIRLSDDTRRVHPVIWHARDLLVPGVPSKQCLERLVCAALAEAYPARAKDVQTWLSSRSDPPPSTPKEHTWSYMAGWFANEGCDDFWRAVWRDDAVRNALVRRLDAIGATRSVMDALGSADPATADAQGTPSA